MSPGRNADETTNHADSNGAKLWLQKIKERGRGQVFLLLAQPDGRGVVAVLLNVRQKVTTLTVAAAALNSMGLHWMDETDDGDTQQSSCSSVGPKGARQVEGKGRGTNASEKTQPPEKRANPRSHDVARPAALRHRLEELPDRPRAAGVGQ